MVFIVFEVIAYSLIELSECNLIGNTSAYGSGLCGGFIVQVVLECDIFQYKGVHLCFYDVIADIEL